ncbi:SDR family oxidoreductase [Williamsia sterculiae]|uniref:NAD(P)H dehydrogenase (Quinone) n=1 Tax=Williamsia sterculiae TaxID=1344003 RepID=A0A1N7GY66_9NOCA|nr:SDR family oxidoreductase [Williamsia sterculiae]SIS17502.1 NAD(P)H dehydrogenase (quinone) [Williamsia sterculiae]
MTTYAVTGATGQLGALTVRALLARGVAAADVVALVRDEAKARDLREAGVTVRVAHYDDPQSLIDGLAGVDRLLLVSGNEMGRRIPQHTNVIDAAQKAGVSLVGYTSILAADRSGLGLATEHLATENLLADRGVDTVLLRNGWYSENFTRDLPNVIERGVLIGAADDGRLAPAARADYADAAAAALIDGTPRVYELAGDEHLSYSEIAATFAEVSGTPVRYENLAEQDYVTALENAGIPTPFAAMLADSDTGVSHGDLDTASTDLADLIGRTPTSFTDVVRDAL